MNPSSRVSYTKLLCEPRTFLSMLASPVLVTQRAHRQDCTCRASLDAVCRASSALYPLANSMNYLANVLASGLQSPKPAETSEPEELLLSDKEEIADQGGSGGLIGDESRGQSRGSLSRIPKTKTVLRFAYPPPVTKHQQRLHIRPKILLQIQQTSHASRPRLVYDVVPSASYASHLAHRIPHHFSGKAGHSADDLVIVSSHAHDSSNLEEEGKDQSQADISTDKRRIIATIRRPKRLDSCPPEDAEIQVGSGSVWKASPLPSGSYEFTQIDEEGHRTVARWVSKRKQTKRQRTGMSGSLGEDIPEAKTFTFSILNPNARRHAVIAKLNPDSIDICDQYSTPPPPLTPSLSKTPGYFPDNLMKQSSPPEPPSSSSSSSSIIVDENLRTLIAVTGIWVALSEDFSPNFKYSQPTNEQQSHGFRLQHNRRGVSLNFSNNHHESPGLLESPTNSKPTKARLSVQRTASSPMVPTIPPPPPPSHTNTPQRRTLSLSSALLQRSKDRRLSAIIPQNLSTVHSRNGSDQDVSLKDNTSCVCQQPSVNEVQLLQDKVKTKSNDWRLATSRGSQSTDEGPCVGNTVKTRKRRGLGKVLGLHRRKSRVP